MKATILKIVGAAGILAMAPMAMAQNQSGNQGQQQGRNQGSKLALDREAVALIGYDLNNDGLSDTYYWVSSWDIENLRRDQQRFQRSGQPMQRQMTERRMGQAQPRQINRGNQRQAMRQHPRMEQQRMEQQRRQAMANQPSRFSGTISDLTTFSFTEDGKDHVVAKVELRDGRTVPVHFGPRDRLNADLSKGQQINFTGRVGRINDSRVIVAKSVGNQRIDSSQPSASGSQLVALRGNIQQTKTFTPQGKNQQHVLAKLETGHGPAIVDLGPVTKLRQNNVSFSQGDRVQLLASPGQINDSRVLLAHKVKPMDRDTSVSIQRQNRILSTNQDLPIDNWKRGGR